MTLTEAPFRLAFVLTLLLAPLAAPLALASSSPDTGAAASASPSPPRACQTPEARQFDFWIGEWEVRTPDGKVAGRNRIVSILGGCVLQEHWTGARGMTGTSINMYDPKGRRWHQTWMDDRGTLLLLDGSFSDGKMVLSGETAAGDGGGKKTRHRITWTPLAEGKVRQLWESSEDGGRTWAVLFDGAYARLK